MQRDGVPEEGEVGIAEYRLFIAAFGFAVGFLLVVVLVAAEEIDRGVRAVDFEAFVRRDELLGRVPAEVVHETGEQDEGRGGAGEVGEGLYGEEGEVGAADDVVEGRGGGVGVEVVEGLGEERVRGEGYWGDGGEGCKRGRGWGWRSGHLGWVEIGRNAELDGLRLVEGMGFGCLPQR